MKMKRDLCNLETSVPQHSVKARLVIAIVVGATFSPLSALAETSDTKAINELLTEKNVENTADVSSNKDKKETSQINNNLDLNSVSNVASNGTNNDASANTNNSDDTTATDANASNSNTVNTTPTVDNGISNAATQEAPVKASKSTADKVQSFLESNALFILGGLIVLLFGSALLFMRKISSLEDANQVLDEKNKRLQADKNLSTRHITQLKSDNAALKAQQNSEPTMLNEQIDDDSDAILLVVDEPVAEVIIEDLDALERKQLSDSITTWLKTNRGNTKIQDLVSKDIQLKLDYLNYKIELWVGSDGVDSVEPTENTMRAAVISLTKPDNQGFAYCYKKPNSLSTVWANKAWYQVQRTDHTIEVSGAPLEIN